MSVDEVRSTRRDFLAASGLVVGFAILPKAFARVGHPGAGVGDSADLPPMNAFVKIGVDNTVTILSKHIEWGQGIFSGLAALVAEELDADWAQMRAVHSPTDDEVYANLVTVAFGMPFQGTFGSSGIANSYEQYRSAGATARAMLVSAAAEAWRVPAGEITVSKGLISHVPSSRTSSFGALAEKAARQVPPAQPVLKQPKDFRLIGKELPRLDTSDKTDGKAMFTLDVGVEHMLVAVVRHPDHFGATVKSFNDAEARKVAGVVDVKPVSSGVAVYAKDTYSALKGRERLKVEWELSKAEKRSSNALAEAYAQKLREEGLVAASKGDVERAMDAPGVRKNESQILFPFLAHAPMEPMDSVFIPASDGSIDILAGTQLPGMDRASASRVLGIDPGKVRVKTQLAGGGFGRRGTWGGPYMAEAAEVFKASGGTRPVKHMYSREDDIRGGYYRPMFLHHVRGAVDEHGKIVSWDHAIVGQPLNPRGGIDPQMVEGVADLPYTVPNLRVRAHNVTLAVPPMFWRSVGHNHTGFAVETFVDELLQMAGRDPVEGRLAQLADPRGGGVLTRVAEMSHWGTPLPEGRQRGVAVVQSFGSYVAEVAELSRDADGSPRVHKVWCAVDCGVAINPNIVRAQMEGSIGFGLGAILFGEITLGDGGVIMQSNFHDYRPLRITEMPQVEVSIIASTEKPTGAGEPGVPPIGPAVANAWRRLTGKRVQRLPMALRT